LYVFSIVPAFLEITPVLAALMEKSPHRDGVQWRSTWQ
jgi:hypothetical protein